jgi:2-methylisocitrate lyase-like PEP mutase family enzyme
MLRSQREKAEEFRSLHRAEGIFVLPNVWDVPSARVFEDAGFRAVATSSAALAVSLGYPDGQRIGKDELFVAVKKIAGKISVPLSVDVESGFGSNLEGLSDTIRRVVEAGGVGVNVEDISSFESKTLVPIEEQVNRLQAVRRAAGSLGVPIVVNARTDGYHFGTGAEEVKVEEALRRARAYAEADVDCLYPIGLTEKALIAKFAKSVPKPINVMARRGLPTVAELEQIGVKRLSLGPGAMYATMGLLKRIARELRQKGTYDALLEGAITFDELNALAEPKRAS